MLIIPARLEWTNARDYIFGPMTLLSIHLLKASLRHRWTDCRLFTHTPSKPEPQMFEISYNESEDLCTYHSTESDVPPEKLLEMVEWMKVNRYPVSQVEDYMNKTALHRGKWIRSNGSKSLPEILTEFPRLVDNPGMVRNDFAIAVLSIWMILYLTDTLQCTTSLCLTT